MSDYRDDIERALAAARDKLEATQRRYDANIKAPGAHNETAANPVQCYLDEAVEAVKFHEKRLKNYNALGDRAADMEAEIRSLREFASAHWTRELLEPVRKIVREAALMKVRAFVACDKIEREQYERLHRANQLERELLSAPDMPMNHREKAESVAPLRDVFAITREELLRDLIALRDSDSPYDPELAASLGRDARGQLLIAFRDARFALAAVVP